MEDKVVVPKAAILVESTRSIGYTFEASVADIIDNSVSAEATDIQVHFSFLEPQWLSIVDNGWGMSPQELENGMRYGSQSSLAPRREKDLGRFGLGLKMASLSQCRSVTVITKKDGVISGACWDLDYIIQKDDWVLKFYNEEEIQSLHDFSWLQNHEAGTVVVWEKFDRIKQESSDSKKVFEEKTELARNHIALVFHRFLNDENPRTRIKISFNGEPVVGIDPFLTKHPATQPLTEQQIRIGSEIIRVKPYILPFVSKMSKADIAMLGGADNLRQQQGFYVYRNKRLIIWGTWFRLIKQNELGKLARVRVDIPNSLDEIWEIDIKKSAASLPYFIRKSLANIVGNVIGKSERVYRYRGRNVQTDNLVHVWNPIDERGNLEYLINRDLPILKMLYNHVDEKGLNLLDSFLDMVEDTFPYGDVYYRMANSESSVPQQSLEKEKVYNIADLLVQEEAEKGGSIEEYLESLEKMDFFVKYPEVIQHLKEVYVND